MEKKCYRRKRCKIKIQNVRIELLQLVLITKVINYVISNKFPNYRCMPDKTVWNNLLFKSLILIDFLIHMQQFISEMQRGLKNVFDESILAALDPPSNKPSKKGCTLV